MKYLLSENEIIEIIDHWNNTPVNAYRGSSYGQDHKKVLFQAMSEDTADQLLQKIKADIPLFANLNSDTLQVLSEDLGHDKKRIYISVGQVLIPIAESDTSNYTGDMYYANAQ